MTEVTGISGPFTSTFAFSGSGSGCQPRGFDLFASTLSSSSSSSSSSSLSMSLDLANMSGPVSLSANLTAPLLSSSSRPERESPDPLEE